MVSVIEGHYFKIHGKITSFDLSRYNVIQIELSSEADYKIMVHDFIKNLVACSFTSQFVLVSYIF